MVGIEYHVETFVGGSWENTLKCKDLFTAQDIVKYLKERNPDSIRHIVKVTTSRIVVEGV